MLIVFTNNFFYEGLQVNVVTEYQRDFLLQVPVHAFGFSMEAMKTAKTMISFENMAFLLLQFCLVLQALQCSSQVFPSLQNSSPTTARLQHSYTGP